MRERWLAAGIAVLAEFGITGLRIDRLAARLGVTKGSFYHHFPGMAGYRLALLDHFEARYTTRYIDQAERLGAGDPAVKLATLVEGVAADIADDDAEIAIRAWATQDDDARATVERVDRRRLDYLTGVISALRPDRTDSLLVSQVLYLTVVGARHVVPPTPVAELRAIFDGVLAELVGLRVSS